MEFDKSNDIHEHDTLVVPERLSLEKAKRVSGASGDYLVPQRELAKAIFNFIRYSDASALPLSQVIPCYSDCDKRYKNVMKLAEDSDDDLKKAIIAREKTIARALAHPNIISPVDYGIFTYFDHRVHFTVYKDLYPVKKETLSADEKFRFLEGVADALDYMHSRNTFHRDVKLDNALLNEQGEGVLIDFGVVHWDEYFEKLLEDRSVGTPEYMAPEITLQELRGSAESDRYSLGIAMWKLFAGDGEIWSRYYKQWPEFRISSVQTLRQGDLSDEQYAVLVKATSFYPDERYSSCGEQVEAFKQPTLSPGRDSNP